MQIVIWTNANKSRLEHKITNYELNWKSSNAVVENETVIYIYKREKLLFPFWVLLCFTINSLEYILT